jgi:hypothetical protein
MHCRARDRLVRGQEMHFIEPDALLECVKVRHDLLLPGELLRSIRRLSSFRHPARF